MKYEERPSAELVRQYEEELNRCLEGIGAKITLVLYERPVDMHLYINDREVDVERHWIRHILVSTSDVQDFPVRMFEGGIGENWRHTAWYEAHNIQGRLYHHLGKTPGHPRDKDPYWLLWDKHPNREPS